MHSANAAQNSELPEFAGDLSAQVNMPAVGSSIVITQENTTGVARGAVDTGTGVARGERGTVPAPARGATEETLLCNFITAPTAVSTVITRTKDIKNSRKPFLYPDSDFFRCVPLRRLGW